MANHQLPMRTGVGIIVLNKNNQVFVGKRKDNPGDKWQMPQGGVDKGCLLYTSPSPRDDATSRMPSSA